MATISVSLPSDGSTGVVSQYNTPINTIVNAINGNLDNANIATAAAIAGSKLANTSVTADKLATGAQNATVATSETTATQTYTDLATVTDTVTATVGANGLALVSIFASIANNSATSIGFVSFAISGTNTQAASDALSIQFTTPPSGANFNGQYGATFLLTGLTAGSSTFKMKYRVNANTGTFVNRRIVVVPL